MSISARRVRPSLIIGGKFYSRTHGHNVKTCVKVVYLLFTRQDKKTGEDEEQEDESSYNIQETEAGKYDDESRRSEEAAEKTKENKKEADDAQERKQRREEDTGGPLSHPPDDSLTSHGTHVTTTITKEVQSTICIGLDQFSNIQCPA